jgi:Transcriptional regulators of sugar metabolism
MFIEERHARILEILAASGRVSITQLQKEFGLSDDSVRRDLRILEEKKLLKRTHGGAISMRQVGTARPHNQTSRDMDSVYPNYLAIAKKAVSMIQQGDVVFITWASLGYLMAQNIPADLQCKIVTNSIIIAEELRTKPNVKIILTGGTMDQKGICHDDFPSSQIKNMRFDKCFITSAAISADFGLSINSPDGASLIYASIVSARYKIGMYPTEKIGFESTVKIADVDILDEIISDSEASEDELGKFEERGVKITIADFDSAEPVTEDSPNPLENSENSVDSDDPQLKQALQIAIQNGKVSTSLLQRKLSVGYGQAVTLLDEMAKRGYIGAADGSKPRDVLISQSEFDELFK